MSERKAQSVSVQKSAALSSLDLFQGLPPRCVKALERGSDVKDFRAGHTFFEPGGSGEVLFLLEKGAVQTFRASGRRKLIISELKPPAVFGEMACVGQRMYHCAAQATEPSRIRMISRVALDDVLEQHPVLTRRFLDLVSQRFVHVLMDLDSTSFRQLIPRLAQLLLEKAEGDVVTNLTHKELAEHLRVYRESATAALGELKKAGIVAVERRKIKILSRPRLVRASKE